MSAWLKILIADERAVTEDAAVLMERWGHRVKQAHDGFSAVDEARLLNPDLMLVALSLPGLNGLGVAKRVRQLPGLKDVKFTAIVSDPAAAPFRDLKRAGFTDNLAKPIVPLELLTSIVKSRDAIRRSRKAKGPSPEGALAESAYVESSPHVFDGSLADAGVPRDTLAQALPATVVSPPSPLVLLETLINGEHLDADENAVASKVLAVGEESLFAWESKIFARVRHRFLLPVCRLCCYRIPQAEVASSWTNGGYCSLCAEAIR